jgi:hypothetical protein
MIEGTNTRDGTSYGKPIDPWLCIPALFFFGLGSVFLPNVMETIGLVAAIVISAILGLSVSTWTLVARRKTGAESVIIWSLDRVDSIRALAVAILYAHWALYHPPVLDHLWLIAAQLPFAYLLDMTFAWRRKGVYRLGLGPVVMVGTINLFMWMLHDWFALQFLMILVAYASRHLLTRPWGEQRYPVFSPTALALVLISAVCLLTNQADITHYKEIATSLKQNPYGFETLLVALFLLQMVVPAVWTCMGALLTFISFGAIYTAVTSGIFFLDTSIPIAAFMAVIMLVSDGETSPISQLGQCLIGILYSTSVIAIYWLIWSTTDMPWGGTDLTYFSALLSIPLVNLLAPLIQRLSLRLGAEALAARLGHRVMSFGPLVILLVVYVVARPSGADSQGPNLENWASVCSANQDQCDRFVAVWRSECTPDGRDTLSIPCVKTASSAYEQGCATGIQTDCGQLGHLLYGDASKEKRARGEALLVNACKAGLHAVCNQFARSLEKLEPKRIELRRQLSRISCDGANANGCEILGMLLYKNAKSPGDFKYASEKLFRGCQKKLPLACTTLAEMLIIGQFGKKSLSRARILFTDACRDGYAPACERLKTLPKPPADRRKRFP